MAIDITKSYSNLKKTILENRKINTTPRSVTEDLFLIPTATELAKQEILLQYINALQSFSSMGELLNSPSKLQMIAEALDTDVDTVKSNISEALEKLASNYSKTRKQATAASGIVSFWTSDKSELNDKGSIPVGTIVASASTGIQYKTTQEVFFGENLNNVYTDTSFGTNGYMIDVPVECTVEGSIGNTVIGDITVCINAVTGFPNVINKSPFVNATDTELDVDFIARMQNEISGCNVGTVNGIKSVILQNTEATSVSVISSGSLLLAPQRRDGGCFDIYVKGGRETITTQNIPVNTSPINIYTAPDTWPKPIVANTASLVGNSIGVTVVNDTTSMYAGSQRAFDKLVFSSTLPVSNTDYVVQYSYNQLITDITNLLQSDEYNTGANILVKRAQPVPVDIFLQVVSYSTDADEKNSYVNTLIQTIKEYIAAMQIGESLEQSDIINLCYIEGINRVVIPLTYFKKTAETSPAVNDVIEVNNTQYIALGNLSITI